MWRENVEKILGIGREVEGKSEKIGRSCGVEVCWKYPQLSLKVNENF